MEISKKKNQHILDLLERIHDLKQIKSIQKDMTVIDNLNFLETRLKDDTFRIASVGEFSSGKSTFINALIGRDLLLHARSETTAAITYIHNVGPDDVRNGSGEVVMRSGKKINLNNLDDIGSYTTVQCQNNVAEEIDHVTIYVNFLPTDYPVIITDTPGFNGNKAHHSDISVNEIKKTHACMYLIGFRGITNSDAELIKHLLEYQSTFFLLQNFKDEFNASEGDTIEKKLGDAEKVVNEIIIPEKKKFNYKLIGISALQAMAARDHSIKYLKEGDTREIREEDREILLEKSGIIELENALTEIINSGEYLNIIADSASEVLRELLDSLISGMNRQQLLNEELRSNSDEQKRIDVAEKLKKSILDECDDRKKRLEKFIVARGDEQQRILKNDIESDSREIYENISKQIDADFKKAIENFSASNDMISYDNLIRQQKGKGASAYYTQKSQEMINSMHKELNGRIRMFIHHLYEEAITKVRNDTKVNVVSDRLSIKINADSSTFAMNVKEVQSHESIIQDYKNQITNLQNKSKKLQADDAVLKNKMMSEQQQLPRLQAAVNSLESQFQNEISNLGRRPDVDEIKRSETKYRPHTGLFHNLRDAIEGYEPYTVSWTDYDDSAQRSWDSRHRKIVSSYESSITDAKNKLYACRFEINDLKDQIGYIEKILKNNEKNISTLIEDIKQENEAYEELKKSAQKKYLEYQKNALKRNLEHQLCGEAETGNVLDWLSEHIKSTYKKYMPDIIKELLNTYQSSVEKRLMEIKRMEQENAAELEKRFVSNEEDIQKITAIREAIN